MTRAGPKFDDVLHAIKGSPRRRGARVSGWVGAWPFRPWVDGDDWQELTEIVDEQIPAEGWRDLVQSWLGVRDD